MDQRFALLVVLVFRALGPVFRSDVSGKAAGFVGVISLAVLAGLTVFRGLSSRTARQR